MGDPLWEDIWRLGKVGRRPVCKKETRFLLKGFVIPAPDAQLRASRPGTAKNPLLRRKGKKRRHQKKIQF
jgi:hypothetical protein